jgi:hypothetical protein
MDSKVLAQIKILPAESILTYEWPGSPQKALEVDLDSLSVVRHPFLVTPIDDDTYLLLSETGHFRALNEAGLDFFPVQVCDAETVRVNRHRLGFDTFSYDDLSRLAARYPDQIALRDGDPQSSEPLGFVGLDFKFADGRRVQTYLRHSSRVGCPLPLEYLFRTVTQNGRYLSIVDGGDGSDSLTRLATIAATVTMPEFSLEDIKSAAQSERLFPPGIIDAVSTRRILDIDFPIRVLKSNIAVSEKESFLKDMILLRRQSRRTAVYEGQVYLLNQQMFS